jgi:hypothetical protein
MHTLTEAFAYSRRQEIIDVEKNAIRHILEFATSKKKERAIKIQNQTMTPLVLEPPQMKKTEKRSICLCFAQQPQCVSKRRKKKKESGLVRRKKKVNRSRLPINPGFECQRYQTLCSHDCVRKNPYAPCCSSHVRAASCFSAS